MPVMTTLVAAALLLAPRSQARPLPSRQADRTATVVIRIGLVRKLDQTTQARVYLPDGAGIVASGRTAPPADAGDYVAKRDGSAVVLLDSDGDAVARGATIRLLPGSAPIGIYAPGDRKPAHYRGTIELSAPASRGSSGLCVVNEAPLEEYLRGVVPQEIGGSAPAEALRAQAVVARTYALMSLGKNAARGFDVTDTTASQAYGGVEAEEPASDAAVAATAGMVVTRRGALVMTDYYDDCGGMTAPGQDEDDYPPSVSDAPSGGGPDYCAAGTYHTWTLALGADDVRRALARAGGPAVGVVQGIEVADEDSSGRAAHVRVTGDRGERVIAASAFRAAVGYDRVRSTLFAVEPTGSGAWLLTGRGHGHGHGLCQQGAIGMAAAPYRMTFRDIVGHYFPGSTVTALSEAQLKRVTLRTRD